MLATDSPPVPGGRTTDRGSLPTYRLNLMRVGSS